MSSVTGRIRHKRRRLTLRTAALERVRDLLSGLAGPGHPSPPVSGGELGLRWATARTAREWNAVEGILDARLCAYVALLWDTQDPTSGCSRDQGHGEAATWSCPWESVGR